MRRARPPRLRAGTRRCPRALRRAAAGLGRITDVEHRANRREGRADLGSVGGEDDIARQGQSEPGAQGRTLDGRHRGQVKLVHRSHHGVEDFGEHLTAVLLTRASVAEITARTKGAAPGADQQDLGLAVGPASAVDDPLDHREGQGVQRGCAVQREHRDPGGQLVGHLGRRGHGSPHRRLGSLGMAGLGRALRDLRYRRDRTFGKDSARRFAGSTASGSPGIRPHRPGRRLGGGL